MTSRQTATAAAEQTYNLGTPDLSLSFELAEWEDAEDVDERVEREGRREK